MVWNLGYGLDLGGYLKVTLFGSYSETASAHIFGVVRILRKRVAFHRHSLSPCNISICPSRHVMRYCLVIANSQKVTFLTEPVMISM